jgi:hypothetical protein
VEVGRTRFFVPQFGQVVIVTSAAIDGVSLSSTVGTGQARRANPGRGRVYGMSRTTKMPRRANQGVRPRAESKVAGTSKGGRYAEAPHRSLSDTRARRAMGVELALVRRHFNTSASARAKRKYREWRRSLLSTFRSRPVEWSKSTVVDGCFQQSVRGSRSAASRQPRARSSSNAGLRHEAPYDRVG